MEVGLVSGLSKLEALLYKMYSKALLVLMVPRLDMCKSISLSKITHQKWHTIFHSADKTMQQQKNKKNHTHVKKVGHTSEFLLGIY